MGRTMKFMITLKPSRELRKEAMRRPRDVMDRETRMRSRTIWITSTGSREKPKRGTRRKSINPWKAERRVPLISLPRTMVSLEMGATSISLRKPNSLSHTTEMVEKTELKSMVIPIIPGIINCL